MDEEEQLRIVKEVGSDVKLLGDFLAKLCLFIALDNGCDKTNIEFETTPTKDNKVYIGKFKYEVKPNSSHN